MRESEWDMEAETPLSPPSPPPSPAPNGPEAARDALGMLPASLGCTAATWDCTPWEAATLTQSRIGLEVRATAEGGDCRPEPWEKMAAPFAVSAPVPVWGGGRRGGPLDRLPWSPTAACPALCRACPGGTLLGYSAVAYTPCCCWCCFCWCAGGMPWAWRTAAAASARRSREQPSDSKELVCSRAFLSGGELLFPPPGAHRVGPVRCPGGIPSEVVSVSSSERTSPPMIKPAGSV